MRDGRGRRGGVPRRIGGDGEIRQDRFLRGRELLCNVGIVRRLVMRRCSFAWSSVQSGGNVTRENASVMAAPAPVRFGSRRRRGRRRGAGRSASVGHRPVLLLQIRQLAARHRPEAVVGIAHFVRRQARDDRVLRRLRARQSYPSRSATCRRIRVSDTTAD